MKHLLKITLSALIISMIITACDPAGKKSGSEIPADSSAVTDTAKTDSVTIDTTKTDTLKKA